MTSDELHAKGMKKRRAILGDAHVDRAEAEKTAFNHDFQNLITRYAWGETWQREGLPDRVRHLIVLALMAALGHGEEFAMHVRATASTGVTPEEIREILHLTAVYAGVPAANTAFRIARDVLEKEGRA